MRFVWQDYMYNEVSIYKYSIDTWMFVDLSEKYAPFI